MKKKEKFVKIRMYTSSIAIKPEQLKYIELIRETKSRAGKLNEIIEAYKKNNKK